MPPLNTADEFWSRVIKTDTCWFWIGNIAPNGYGRYAGKTAHRYAKELELEREIPHGIDACHTCDVRRCVRLDHIFEGTRSENILDAIHKGRATPPVFRGGGHKSSKLTQEKVDEIRRLFATGNYTKKALGIMFGVTRTMIRYIVTGKNWVPY